MKKEVIGIFALLFCMSITVHGQLDFGLKAGLNVSRVHHKSRWDKEVYGFMPSAHVGMFAHMTFNENFFLSGEFLLSDKGFERDASTHLLYSSFPVTANFMTLKGLFLGVGLEPGILIAALGKDRQFVKEVYSNRLDVGGVIGLQYAVSSSLSISFRWVRGFSNIVGWQANVPFYQFDKQNGILLSSDLREAGFVQKNESFQLSLGYLL
jgi:hypothetical protein